jgi:hypothetical protein
MLKARSPFRALATVLNAEYLTAGEFDAIEKAAAARRWNFQHRMEEDGCLSRLGGTIALEMARNYWDEMGRGASKGMHGPMLERLERYLDVHPSPGNVIPEALALGNMMIALAHNRRYAYHSIGALGVIEMTAPTRAGYVDRGLQRLGIPTKKRHYFALHAVLDIKHSDTWNREIVRSLVADDPRRAQAIGEGALLRLWHGACCFARYRESFQIPWLRAAAA